MVARSVLRMMRGSEYRFVHVETAGAARRAVTDAGCEVALVDRSLPDGDGLALARELQTAGLRVAVVSGELAPMGVNLHWLTKPFRRKELDALLVSLADGLPEP